MIYELTIASYEKHYAKAIAWAGANGIEFEETRTYGGDRAIEMDLTHKQMKDLWNDLLIEGSPKVRLP